MIIEVDAMFRIDEDNLEEWEAKFDPGIFQQKYKDIKLQDWKLTDIKLELYAYKVLELR